MRKSGMTLIAAVLNWLVMSSAATTEAAAAITGQEQANLRPVINAEDGSEKKDAATELAGGELQSIQNEIVALVVSPSTVGKTTVQVYPVNFDLLKSYAREHDIYLDDYLADHEIPSKINCRPYQKLMRYRGPLKEKKLTETRDASSLPVLLMETPEPHQLVVVLSRLASPSNTQSLPKHFYLLDTKYLSQGKFARVVARESWAQVPTGYKPTGVSEYSPIEIPSPVR